MDKMREAFNEYCASVRALLLEAGEKCAASAPRDQQDFNAGYKAGQKAALAQQEEQNVRLHRELCAYAALRLTLEGWEPATAVHFWQGDGEDDLQTLCAGVPVVIEAQTLRELIATQQGEQEPVAQFGLNTGGGAWGAAEGKTVWFASEEDRDIAFGEAHLMDCPRKVERDILQPATIPEGLQQVLAFLLGKAPLDGIWFGDGAFSKEVINEKRGAFWWRRNLRKAMLAAAPKENNHE